MTIIIGLLLAIAVVVEIVIYWIIMATLFLIGIVFVFWAILSAFIFGDPYVGGVCSILATGLTFWFYHYCKNKPEKIS